MRWLGLFLSLTHCLIAQAFEVERSECKPTTMLMTRVSADPRVYVRKRARTVFPLGNTNLASLNGALKYLITEAIDKSAYTGTCERKNQVKYIHFYKVSVCNPNQALWWFNKRRNGYGKQPKYDDGIFGQYLTFDQGRCHGSELCYLFAGNDDKNLPALGPFVGFKRDTTDMRNPTYYAYWYSLPGECPLLPWAQKTSHCIKNEPSGRCPKGVLPDGKTCTWSDDYLGQVNVDQLVGITALKRNETHYYQSAKEFCEDGNVEFERNRNDEFIRGLEFWKNVKDPQANKHRINQMIQLYHDDPKNIRLPTVEELKKMNPRCYETTPNCYDYKTRKETCGRDVEMLCVQCRYLEGGCDELPLNKTRKPFGLGRIKKVLLPSQRKEMEKYGSTGSLATCSSMSFSITLVFSLAQFLYLLP